MTIHLGFIGFDNAPTRKVRQFMIAAKQLGVKYAINADHQTIELTGPKSGVKGLINRFWYTFFNGRHIDHLATRVLLTALPRVEKEDTYVTIVRQLPAIAKAYAEIAKQLKIVNQLKAVELKACRGISRVDVDNALEIPDKACC